MFCYVKYTSLKQTMTLRKRETVVGLIWSLAQSCDDGCVAVSKHSAPNKTPEFGLSQERRVLL